MMFKFCPECKGSLKKDSIDLLVCTLCGFPFYINAKPVANLLLENEKRQILLVKRKYPPKRGFWDLPGGFLELNETFEEGLAREIEEELHIGLNKPKYFASYADRYRYKGKNYHIVITIFTDKQHDPQIRIDDDASDFAFFNRDAIPYDTMSCMSDTRALKDFIIQTQ